MEGRNRGIGRIGVGRKVVNHQSVGGVGVVTGARQGSAACRLWQAARVVLLPRVMTNVGECSRCCGTPDSETISESHTLPRDARAMPLLILTVGDA